MASGTTDNMDSLNPETLKAHRKRRGWSQQELAERCECLPQQVSRWERGAEKPQPRYRTALVKALGVKWEDLTRPLPQDDRAGPGEKVQLNVRVDTRTRNALALVCHRYGVQASEVIGLAPLLFLINAEKSLEWRQKNLALLQEVTEKLSAIVPHLDFDVGLAREQTEFPKMAEEDSINLRDLFGRHLAQVLGEPENPFMNYLEHEAAPLKSTKLIEEIYADIPGENGYLLWAEEDLRSAVGLTGNGKYDDEFLMHIRVGDINLEEAIQRRKNLSDEEFSEWMVDQVKAHDVPT